MSNGSSSAMELKVLISVLQNGTALQTMLGQVNQLSQALSALQLKAATAGVAAGGIGGGTGNTAAAIAAANALAAASGNAAAGITGAGAAAAAAAPKMLTLEQAVNKTWRAIQFLAGGFLAYQSVRFIKNIADVAARTEVLNTVLHVVALNAGYTEQQIDKVSRGVQRLGITAQSANQSLTQFLQAGLKIEFAEQLARASQDLAVVSGMDSSQTFQRLLVNIQQLDTLGLRHMGIIVSRTEAEAKFANSLKTSVNALSQRQKQESLMIAVIEKARGLEGAYEAAMGNVGKQLTSLTRYTQDLRSEIGKHLLPAYSAIISELSLFLSKMQDLAIASSTNMDWAERLATVTRTLAHWFFQVVEVIIKYRQAIYTLVAAYGAYWAIVTGRAIWAHLITVVTTLTTSVLSSAEAIVKATRATYAWIAALQLLRGAQATNAVTQTGQFLLFPIEKETRLVTGIKSVVGWLKTLGLWLLEASRISLVLRAAWAGLVPIVAGLGLPLIGWIAGIVAAVTAFGAFTVALVKFTSVGTMVSSVIDKLRNAFSALTRIGIGDKTWEVLTNAANTFSDSITQLKINMEALFRVMEQLPGNPVNKVKLGLSIIDLAIDVEIAKIKKLIEWLEKLGIIKVKAPAPGERSEESLRLEQQLNDKTAELAEAKEAEELAKTAFGAANKAGKYSEIKRTEEELKKLSEEVKRLLKQRDDLVEKSRQTDPEALAASEAHARRSKFEQDLNILVSASNDAKTKLLKVNILDGLITTKEFDEKRGQLKVILDALDKLRTSAARAAGMGRTGADGRFVAPPGQPGLTTLSDDLRGLRDQALASIEGAKVMSGAPGLISDLKGFDEEMARIRRTVTLTPKDEQLLQNLEQVARLRAEEGERSVLAPLTAIRKARFEAVEKQLRSSLEEQLDIQKNANEQAETINKESLERGLLSVQEYYNRRRRAASDAYGIELMLATQNVEAMKRRVVQVRGQDEPTRIAAREALAEAEQQRRQVVNQRATSVTAFDAEERNAILAFDRKRTDAALASASAYGSETEALNALNNQYLLRVEALGGDIEAERIAKAELVLNTLKTQIEFEERRTQAEIEATKAKSAYLDVSQAEVDLAKQRIAIGEKLGALTTYEAMQARNALTNRQIEIDTAKKAGKEDELAQKRLQVKQAQANIDKLITAGFAADNEFMLKANAALRQAQAEVLGLETAVLGLQGTIEEGRAGIESYGQTLKEDFVKGFSDALTQTITDFKKAGDAWINLGRSISNQIVDVFMTAFTQRLFAKIGLFKFVDALMNRIFGGGGGGGKSGGLGLPGVVPTPFLAGGGPVNGPGTGTSDSIPAMVSAGEHIMPASKAAKWMPVLEGIRLGRITPAFALGGVVALQSIAAGPVIPRRYAGGGMVMTDAGASAVVPGATNGNMTIALHPDALNMTMRDWLEHEVVRQHGRR